MKYQIAQARAEKAGRIATPDLNAIEGTVEAISIQLDGLRAYVEHIAQCSMRELDLTDAGQDSLTDLYNELLNIRVGCPLCEEAHDWQRSGCAWLKD